MPSRHVSWTATARQHSSCGCCLTFCRPAAVSCAHSSLRRAGGALQLVSRCCRRTRSRAASREQQWTHMSSGGCPDSCILCIEDLRHAQVELSLGLQLKALATGCSICQPLGILGRRQGLCQHKQQLAGAAISGFCTWQHPCESTFQTSTSPSPSTHAVLCAMCCRQLSTNIAATESLDQLQTLLVRHAHQMNGFLLVQAVGRTPQASAGLAQATCANTGCGTVGCGHCRQHCSVVTRLWPCCFGGGSGCGCACKR